MVNYRLPGTYIEEVSSRGLEIAGLPTGVAGFVRLGTAGQSGGRAYASAAEYEADNVLWQAARTFFDEGGKRLFVANARADDADGVGAALAELALADPALPGGPDVVAAPGLTGAHVAPALIAHAQAQRRFALIDPPPGLDVAGVQAFAAGLNSRHAALFWPWVLTADGPQPPSAHIAGIIARVDAARGIWKSPANEIIRGAIGFEHAVTTAEQAVLNPLGINCLRAFVGRGKRVWGARTLSIDPEFKYINVCRQIDWIARSLEAGLAWAVFEAATEQLQAQVRAAAEAFLSRHWRDGGLQGAKASDAYFVRCDGTTMTQHDIDAGQLVVLIGIAPVRPAEFIIIRIFLKS